MALTSTLATGLGAEIDGALHWLLHSGIQVADGGFVGWYSPDSQTVPFVYSEITGYAVSTLCHLHAVTGRSEHLHAAIAAANWLTRTTEHRTGAFRCLFPIRPTRFDGKQYQVYAHDTGVIVNALVNAYRATSRDVYLATAVQAADWLLTEAQEPGGAFRAAFDLRAGTFLRDDDAWSLRPGPHHTKVALGLANLAAATGQQQYADAAIRACDAAVALQQPDGRFPSFPGGGTNAHPHAYAAEGLWGVANLLDRPDYHEASARATDWLLDRQDPDGRVPRHVHDGTATYHERVDVLAQALRLAVLHRRTGPGVDRLAGLVRAARVRSADPRADGGFAFGRLADGTPSPDVNVWVTAFAVQALLLAGGVPLDPRLLA
jgi:hypothetical protein